MNDQELTDDKEELYPCPQCEKRYATQAAVYLHIDKCHGGMYGCDECGRHFVNRPALRLHCFRLGHSWVSDTSSTSKELYPCLLCEKPYATQAAMIFHMNKFHGGMYGCGECGRHFRSRIALAMHCFTLGHSKVSDKSSASKDGSNDQQVKETVQKELYPCPQCKERFRTKAGVTLHVNNDHGGKYGCDKCGRDSMKSRTSAMRCRRSHMNKYDGGKYGCEKCEKHSVNSQALTMRCQRSHSRTSHVSSTGLTSKHVSQEEWYSCRQCEERFRRQASLILHMDISHGARYKCDQCERHFISDRALMMHRRRSHYSARRKRSTSKDGSRDRELTGTGVSETVQEELYLCPRCGEQFHQQVAMNWHLENFHQDEYKRDECGKRLKSNQAIAIHKQTHAKASDRSATNKYGVNDGKLTDDEEEEPYPCLQWEKQFRMQLALKWHVKKVHRCKYKCDECGRHFLSNLMLASHRRSHSTAGKKHATSTDGLNDCEITATRRETSAHDHEMLANDNEISATSCEITATSHEISATGEELYSCPQCDTEAIVCDFKKCSDEL